MKHIIMFSGGIGSWITAKRVAERNGTDNMLLLFADTLMEDEDLYRFLDEAATDVGAPLLKIAEGRDPWEVFNDVKFLGNTRIDPCSRVLKRQLLRDWLEKHHQPEETRVYIGIDHTESHRYDRALKYWEPWICLAPMCEPPLMDRAEVRRQLASAGIELPRLYHMGFPHNNCGGFCIKAGQAHFKLLLQKMPCRYAFHEAKEEEFRQKMGKDVAILRDRRGGKVRPLTLRELRRRIEAQEGIEEQEWGGCGCFTPAEY